MDIHYTSIKKMGIKHLNKYLLKRCSKNAIKRVYWKDLQNKRFIIDTSIYLYKFLGDGGLLENMYLFINKMKHYNIEPVFIFDGKPPVEKRELLQKRRIEKRAAENKYELIKAQIYDASFQNVFIENKKDLLEEMEELKGQFIKIKDDDIRKVKSLLNAFGVQYVESKGEADNMCAYLTSNEQNYCVSDDMDMFIYGSKYIVRNINLQNDSMVLYNTENILKELELNQEELKKILILSGTDYNIDTNTSLYESIKWFQSYKKEINKTEEEIGFYDWLLKNTKYIENKDKLFKILKYFSEDYLEEFSNFELEENKGVKDDNRIKEILKDEGFVFL